MKNILVCCSISMLISIQSLSAQSQLVNELSDAVIEVTGSFMDNPYHHANTIKIVDLTKEFITVTDEMITNASISSSSLAKTDLPYLKNMERILRCLDFVVASIAGYSRKGIDATEWESIFHPAINGFG